jgi:hypothetical protein
VKKAGPILKLSDSYYKYRHFNLQMKVLFLKESICTICKISKVFRMNMGPLYIVVC